MRIGTPLVVLAWLFATSAVLAAPVEDLSSPSTGLSSTSVSSSTTSAASSSALSSSATESASNSTSESSLAPESSSASSALSSNATSSASPTSSASLTSSASSSAPSPSGSSSCGPVPNNTVANSDDAIPDQYIVALKPSSDVQQHFSKVQAAMAKNLQCNDPGAPTNTSLNTTDVIQIPQGVAIYRGLFSDRDVAFIQNTSEFQSISRDMKAVESRKRRQERLGIWPVLRSRTDYSPVQLARGRATRPPIGTLTCRITSAGGVYIYVIDTGVDGNHPLLTPRVQAGRSTQGGAGNVEGDGHGTEVAGAAAATYFGVASGATIIPIKIYASAQTGDLYDLVDGVDSAVSDFQLKQALNANAAAIINISIDAPNDPGLQSSIAWALQKGMHVVIAAGNEGRDRSNDWITMRTNANVQAAINVGAININDNLATFPTAWAPGSNYGACVDVYAGGFNVLTSGPGQQQSYVAHGTSVAAPQVAGIIAGVISLHGNMSPAQMKAYILSIGAVNRITGLSGSSNNLLAQFPSSFLA
ncbi:peptidase S8/S53 domain-containing protein [Mycena galericulata]|nr:peptidase S8/S53 domain-containing protein [Mycena galericulata]